MVILCLMSTDNRMPANKSLAKTLWLSKLLDTVLLYSIVFVYCALWRTIKLFLLESISMLPCAAGYNSTMCKQKGYKIMKCRTLLWQIITASEGRSPTSFVYISWRIRRRDLISLVCIHTWAERFSGVFICEIMSAYTRILEAYFKCFHVYL